MKRPIIKTLLVLAILAGVATAAYTWKLPKRKLVAPKPISKNNMTLEGEQRTYVSLGGYRVTHPAGWDRAFLYDGNSKTKGIQLYATYMDLTDFAKEDRWGHIQGFHGPCPADYATVAIHGPYLFGSASSTFEGVIAHYRQTFAENEKEINVMVNGLRAAKFERTYRKTECNGPAYLINLDDREYLEVSIEASPDKTVYQKELDAIVSSITPAALEAGPKATFRTYEHPAGYEVTYPNTWVRSEGVPGSFEGGQPHLIIQRPGLINLYGDDRCSPEYAFIEVSGPTGYAKLYGTFDKFIDSFPYNAGALDYEKWNEAGDKFLASLPYDYDRDHDSIPPPRGIYFYETKTKLTINGLQAIRFGKTSGGLFTCNSGPTYFIRLNDREYLEIRIDASEQLPAASQAELDAIVRSIKAAKK